jgi:8-oxo-dGTP diphosphatase
MRDRSYPDRPLVGVGAVIIDGERALLVKRGGEPLKGQWSIPGGLVEVGESLRDAVIREAREETGLDVEPGKVVEVFERIHRDTNGKTEYHYVLIDYLCRKVSGEARAGSDAAELRWVRLSELASMELTEGAEKVIRKAFHSSDGLRIGARVPDVE